MKKNAGRKMRREHQRNLMAEMKKESKKVTYVKNENPTEPHPNAVRANQVREEIANNILDTYEGFKKFFAKTTKIGAEMIAEQKDRLKRRDKWMKEKGLV